MSSDLAPPQDTVDNGKIDVDVDVDSTSKPTDASNAGTGRSNGDSQGPPANRKRPRLDLASALGGDRERKRGKSMFGIVLGTLNKAKIEDKERNASEAAKKRQLIEQRLQIKLKKETDSVRRAEDAKKDKAAANRKEEELQLKDSIYKLRRKRLPLLANFLSTSDDIPEDESMSSASSNPLAQPPRSHPPPLYYLPAVLLPSQAAFIARRKAEVEEAAEKEWQAFKEERSATISDMNALRQKVLEEEARQRVEQTRDKAADSAVDEDAPMNSGAEARGHEMDVDDGGSGAPVPPAGKAAQPVGGKEKKDDSVAMQADDDDAVEY